MRILKDLEPERVFYYFEELSKIPHGSKNTKAVSDYCVRFAREHDLKYIQDASNNVMIYKKSAEGYETAKPVMLQGHLDMVCEKTSDCRINMEQEGLQLYIKDGYVCAKDTTLGSDDGIAVAMALAILEDNSLKHPALEVIFTVDEEIGMLGAQVIDVSKLSGRTMLNIDSEVEGIFTVSCAGGSTTKCILPVAFENVTGDAYSITIDGLTGGHSGIEIDKGRANASVIIGRLLQDLKEYIDFRIVSVDGGLKDNAIPNKAKAVIFTADLKELKKYVRDFTEKVRKEFEATEAGMQINIQEQSIEKQAMNRDSSDKLICMLTCLPNGIQNMSMDIEGLVKTSLNMGIVRTDKESVEISYCVRSSLASEKEMLNRRLQTLMLQLGGRTEIEGEYPAWEYRRQSPLRDLMVEVYKEQYQGEPKIEAVHAGVECGLFAGKIKDLDCVSFGPNLKEIHTTAEKMEIASVKRVYLFVLEVLRRLK